MLYECHILCIILVVPLREAPPALVSASSVQYEQCWNFPTRKLFPSGVFIEPVNMDGEVSDTASDLTSACLAASLQFSCSDHQICELNLGLFVLLYKGRWRQFCFDHVGDVCPTTLNVHKRKSAQLSALRIAPTPHKSLHCSLSAPLSWAMSRCCPGPIQRSLATRDLAAPYVFAYRPIRVVYTIIGLFRKPRRPTYASHDRPSSS